MDSLNRFLFLLAPRTWIYAKTMPENPHWYTLRRDWHHNNAFDEAVHLIRTHGYVEYFKGRPYTMLDCNGYKYWTMGAPIPDTILVNRKPLADRPAPFDPIAYTYDAMHSSEESLAENAEVMAMLDLRGSVLDVGCGTGLLLNYATGLSGYTGIDPSRRMLDVLKVRHPDAHTIQTRLEDYATLFPHDTIVSLFGSPAYVRPDTWRRLPYLLTEGGTYFLMFYAPDYNPVTHVKAQVNIPTFPPSALPGRTETARYKNFLIVRGEI